MRHWLFPKYQANSAAPVSALTSALRDSAAAKAHSWLRKIVPCLVIVAPLTTKIAPLTVKVDPSTAKINLSTVEIAS